MSEVNEHLRPVGSNGLLVKDLTIGCVFKHRLRAQHGLTTEDIINNLDQLCTRIIDPLMLEFPDMRINTCFRAVSAGGGKHEKGLAVDVQHTSKSGDLSFVRQFLTWCNVNLSYDRFIVQTSDSFENVWFHIDIDTTNRNKRMTYINGTYTEGWNLP